MILKEWQKPEMTVLVRSKPEETVLATCKAENNRTGPATDNTYCQRSAPNANNCYDILST